MHDHSVAEEWRSVPGFEGAYSVSNLGRVASTPRKGTPGGILRLSVDKRGYQTVNLWNGRGQTFRVHRIVTAAFLSPRPEGMTVNHINGVKADNRVANLEYVTRTENIRHARCVLQIGGMAQRKLSDEAVREIRAMSFENPGSLAKAARQYGVDTTTLRRAAQAKTYKHVT